MSVSETCPPRCLINLITEQLLSPELVAKHSQRPASCPGMILGNWLGSTYLALGELLRWSFVGSHGAAHSVAVTE